MKKVLITGASRGIGKAIAEVFAQNNYELVCPTRSELDLNSLASVRQFVQAHQSDYFAAVINNAGCNDVNFIDEITDDEIQQMIQVNLVAPLYLLRGFAGQMKEQRYGRIVNIGSVWGIVSKPGRTVYSATKHALHGVTNTLAAELAPYNILVNTVCPGFTLTDLTYKNNTPEQLEAVSRQIPIKRMAQPEEIAKTVFFLAHETNTYITGQQLAVDGGFTCI